MAVKEIPNAAARPAWTDELAAQRAAEFLRLKSASRFAHSEYKNSCKRFKTRRGIDYLDVNDPKFRRATRKAYDALQKARVAERNALRRLETAVLNCPASAPNESAKTSAATPPRGTLEGNLALVESCCRMLNLSPSERLALLRNVAERHSIDLSGLPGFTIAEVQHEG